MSRGVTDSCHGYLHLTDSQSMNHVSGCDWLVSRVPSSHWLSINESCLGVWLTRVTGTFISLTLNQWIMSRGVTDSCHGYLHLTDSQSMNHVSGCDWLVSRVPSSHWLVSRVPSSHWLSVTDTVSLQRTATETWQWLCSKDYQNCNLFRDEWKPVYPVWTMPNSVIAKLAMTMITGVSLLFGNVALRNFNLWFISRRSNGTWKPVLVLKYYVGPILL